MPLSPRTRAVRLLELLLQDQCFTEDELASELIVRPGTLAAFRTGSVPMPLDRQLLLALLAIEKAPRHARLARQLRAQVAAAVAYETNATETHDSRPATMWNRAHRPSGASA